MLERKLSPIKAIFIIGVLLLLLSPTSAQVTQAEEIPLVTEGSTITELETYKISGYKWHDTNGDGYWNEEPTLPGWAITLSEGETILHTITDTNGYYEFIVNNPALYTVSEEIQTGWTQTGLLENSLAISGSFTCTFGLITAPSEGEPVVVLNKENTCDFGNQSDEPETESDTQKISGYKWHDTNGDGYWDESEIGLNDWEINLTDGQNSFSTTTNNNGYYEFYVNTNSLWTVSETKQTGWTQTGLLENDLAISDSFSCTFGILTEPQNIEEIKTLSLDNTCDFGNQADTDLILQPVIEPIPERSTRSGGSRRNTIDTLLPTPLILGVSTSSVQLCPFLSNYLQSGAPNDSWEVTKLQLFLTTIMNLNTPTTGYFDETTVANVKLFQERYRSEILDPWYDRGIVSHNRPTGFVYKTTKWKINDLICPKSEPYPNLSEDHS